MRLSKTFVASLLALSACASESVESNDVLTDGIYASFEAVATEDGTRATATLLVGGSSSNTYVMLGGDDALTVTAAGETLELRERQGFGERYYYDADLATNAEDTVVVFRFERSIDSGAPDSRCTLPRAMTITAPSDGDAFSRMEADVLIAWDTSGTNEPIQLQVQGDCFTAISESFDSDPGEYVIPAATLQSSQDPATACQATVTLSRNNNGTLDPAFGEGGSVLCRQVRTTTFRSDP
jgi:hypothetical protein